ncbi:MAG: hypothetical protein U5K37_12045 [Natrialbaceae archaeon]|nr:hypothetical protein [Natrialbaceae archaeon]
MVERQNSSRRRVLTLAGTAVVGGLAGCTQSDPDGNESEQPDSTDTPTRPDCSSPTSLSPEDVKDGGEIAPGCYQADQRLIVENGTLSIDAGVLIEFAAEAGIDVRSGGSLQTNGTASAPVVLTGSEDVRASWRGVRFKNSRSDQNMLDHTIIEYAGDSQWHGADRSKAGLFLESGVTAVIRNVTIKQNAKMGLTATGEQADLTIESVSFEGNEAPLWLEANLVGALDASNAFSNNDDAYVYLGFGHSTTDVTDEATWPALGLPYRPTRNVSVAAPVELQPGTTIEFEQDVGMRVHHDGRLIAEGTGEDPIVFTGIEDISGFWQGLYFINSLSTDNSLEHVVIENGGSSRWHGGENSVGNLFLRGGDKAAAVSITQSTIRGSGKYGISMEGGARVQGCGGMVFENNTGADTYNDETGGPIASCQ